MSGPSRHMTQTPNVPMFNIVVVAKVRCLAARLKTTHGLSEMSKPSRLKAKSQMDDWA